MDNWHLEQIPRTLHTYWGGGHMMYIRYLTLKTFIDQNPDWQVYLWYPKKHYVGQPSWNYMPGMPKINEVQIKNYWPEALKLNLTAKEINFDELGFRENTPEVHKADYMRINCLYQVGGVWSDMDIIYFAPITKLLVNGTEYKDKETFVCISPHYGHSTGFNMAVPKSQFFGILSGLFNQNYDPHGYQCWGPDIFNKYFKSLASVPSGVDIGMDAVYAHDCHHVTELLETNAPRFTKDSIGCHWYGGHVMWVKFFNETFGGERNLKNNIIGNIIKNASKNFTL